MKRFFGTILGGIKGGLKGAATGGKFVWKNASRPEVLTALTIAGGFIPGGHIPIALRFMRWGKQAEAAFPNKGSGKQKLKWVLRQANGASAELHAAGITNEDFRANLEMGLLIAKGILKLQTPDGVELTPDELDELALLMES